MIRARTYASFPWYDLDEMRPATDALWRSLAAALEARGVSGVPSELDRVRPHGTDAFGECLFTQTCGYPLFTTARDQFTVLGAPWYDVAGCSRAFHRSFVVVRAGSLARTLADLRGTRFAINERDSNSGMNLPRRLFAPLAARGRFFGDVVVTGAHAASALAIAEGAADCAAIDCVTFALLARYRPALVRELRVVGETDATPTPPLVTARATDAETVSALRAAIGDALRDPALADVRAALFLSGITFCDAAAYDVVMRFEREAIDLGYPIPA